MNERYKPTSAKEMRSICEAIREQEANRLLLLIRVLMSHERDKPKREGE